MLVGVFGYLVFIKWSVCVQLRDSAAAAMRFMKKYW